MYNEINMEDGQACFWAYLFIKYKFQMSRSTLLKHIYEVLNPKAIIKQASILGKLYTDSQRHDLMENVHDIRTPMNTLLGYNELMKKIVNLGDTDKFSLPQLLEL